MAESTPKPRHPHYREIIVEPQIWKSLPTCLDRKLCIHQDTEKILQHFSEPLIPTLSHTTRTIRAVYLALSQRTYDDKHPRTGNVAQHPSEEAFQLKNSQSHCYWCILHMRSILCKRFWPLETLREENEWLKQGTAGTLMPTQPGVLAYTSRVFNQI
ncbi:hypothetical protein CC86DRAFT_377323 [Ophiobolus disseminans]|uniref:Uncharacterized protein n=1 Tax=Ophiobolus disseminans TaxID=1469910 RepID=A0A6A7AFU3_9PLEO|nr:hypothetical protein CC86DRAFT_377323 [Ophiobolus disseminans]